MLIKALETTYRGIQFRSRKEARWAVFFDELGVSWEYEPEAYELPSGKRYLPDFWLPKQNAFWEVKGTKHDQGVDKFWEFSATFDPGDGTMGDRAVQCLLSFGPVAPPLTGFGLQCNTCGNDATDSAYFNGWDNSYRWCQCPLCGAVDIEYDGRAGRIDCACSIEDKTYNVHSPQLHAAYTRVQGYRFWNPETKHTGTRRVRR